MKSKRLTKILRFVLLFLLLTTLSWVSVPVQGQEQPQPVDPPNPSPLTQQQLDRVYCLPEVIGAMNTIWAATINGTSTWEAAFIVSSLGGVYIEPMERDRPYAQTVAIFGNTVALFHVHPNAQNFWRGEWPSTPENNYEGNGKGDTGLADEFKIDVYVVSSLALTRYRPGYGNSLEKVGMTWMKPGKECK